MSKSVLIRARTDDVLRARFQAAAVREHSSAAKVLRRMMEAYVTMQSIAEAGGGARRPGLERCAAASVVTQVPGRAAQLLVDDRSLEEMVERQYGWTDSAFRAG